MILPFRLEEMKSDVEKNNGGVVAALEKNADMLIADHARKDAPPGSYSWKLITDSVDNGIIQLKDRYRIGRDPEIPRPAAGGGLTKATRTAFTHAEDVALAKWALSHAVDRTGNKIYQKFAETVSLSFTLSLTLFVLILEECTAYLAVVEEQICEDTTCASS